MKPVYVTVLTFVDGTHRLLARGQRLVVDSQGHWTAKWNVYGGARRSQPLGLIITKVEILSSEEAATRFKMVFDPMPIKTEDEMPFDAYKVEEAELKTKRKRA